jgi:Domain of unknown function (DUF4174)
MKQVCFVGVFVLGLVGTAMATPAQDAPLSKFRWKNRVLVVIAPSAENNELIAQRRIFQQASTGMAERDVVLVEAAGDDDRARKIRMQLSISGNGFRAVLVGKDGNVAFSAANPATAAQLFSKIDAMPMRRDEMRSGK